MDKKWILITKELKKLINDAAFLTFIKPLKPLEYSKNKKSLLVQVPDELRMTTLKNRYLEQIEEIVSGIYGENTSVYFCLPEDSENYLSKKLNHGLFDEELDGEVIINPRHTFETFVVGDNNRYAQAISLAVADAPGENISFNPLFIYGGAGLGKTHLMHAIGHYVKVNHPKKKVLYVTSQMFSEEFIYSTSKHKLNEFKIKYRNVDVLLLDDIQFIEEREKTREEVFHTYNALHDSGKQLVFSSDRHPNEFLGLDERLTSRLSEGLIVDIKPPSFETKIAILLNKAGLEGIEITDGLQDVIELIADKVKTNIREMEGAFNKVIAYSAISGKSINKEFACEVLKDITAADAQPTPESIKKHVSNFYEIKISDIESKKKARNFSFPRQIAMYLCRDMTELSTTKIGEQFGGKDHTTVMYAYEKIEKEIKINETLSNNIEEMKNKIRNI